MRLAKGDVVRIESQQIFDVMELDIRRTHMGCKRVPQVVPVKVFDFRFREALLKPLPR
jgi:hypothetical protein